MIQKQKQLVLSNEFWKCPDELVSIVLFTPKDSGEGPEKTILSTGKETNPWARKPYLVI